MNMIPRRTLTLSTQMMLIFTGIVVLTAIAAWVPEIWLIQDYYEREMWARVEQGRLGVNAFYGSMESEVDNAAILAAQLPTLQTLVTNEETDRLFAYLYTVETSLDLDILLVCNPDTSILAQIGADMEPDVCDRPGDAGIFIDTREELAQGWLLAARPIQQEGESLGTVVAGVRLDNEFARQVRAEIGLEHTLLADGEPIATSFPGGRPYLSNLINLERVESVSTDSELSTFSWQARPFYATRFMLSEPGMAVELALEATENVAAQRRLVQTVTLSILAIIVVGSITGIVSARRISKPLLMMARAGTKFSEGDLSLPITVDSNVREVIFVAQTLEQARVNLQQTLAELHQEKAWIEHLLQAIVEGIITLDDSNRITFFSRGAERITGWQRDDVLGRHCDDLFPLLNTDKSFNAVIPLPGQRRKLWVRLPQGEVALSITHAELAPPEAGVDRTALVFRDVSEEEAVQQLMGHFLANVTHEFRTPLTALGASVELLLDQSTDRTEQELDQMLSWLHLGILSLQRLVDNLLESASLEAGRFHIIPHPANIREIIATAVNVIQPLLEKYNQRLILEIPNALPTLYVDSRRIAQVLVNLLSNANKFAPEHSDIELRVEILEEQLLISVSDHGPGVATEVQASLFQPFSHFMQDGSQEQGKYGIGLGLWVVKATVEAHGGSVGVEEQPSSGSTFWFTLPFGEIV